MLAVTFAVQGAFLGFFLYLRKRAQRVAEIELDSEWSDPQRSSRTSDHWPDSRRSPRPTAGILTA